MKSVKLTSLLCGGMLSLAGSSVLAQQSSSTDPNPSSTRSPQTSPSTLGSSSTSSSVLGSNSGALGSMHSGNAVRLSQLMNSPVQSQDGKSLGYIRDVTVDPQSGRIEFAIMSLNSAGAATDTSTSGRETVPSSRSSASGIPGSASAYSATGKLIPVPWQLFSQSWTGSQLGTSSSTTATASGMHNLVLNLDESKLRSAPSFDSSNWNELQGGTFDQRVYSYYGVDRTSGTGTSGSSISGQGTSGSSYRGTSPDSTTTPPNSSSPNSNIPK